MCVCVCQCEYIGNSQDLRTRAKKMCARSPLWVTHRRSESRDLTLVRPLLRTLTSYNSRRDTPPRASSEASARYSSRRERSRKKTGRRRKKRGKKESETKKVEISSLPRRTIFIFPILETARGLEFNVNDELTAGSEIAIYFIYLILQYHTCISHGILKLYIGLYFTILIVLFEL